MFLLMISDHSTKWRSVFKLQKVSKCYFEDGFHETNIYLLEELSAGHTIEGPAVIVDKTRFAQWL